MAERGKRLHFYFGKYYYSLTSLRHLIWVIKFNFEIMILANWMFPRIHGAFFKSGKQELINDQLATCHLLVRWRKLLTTQKVVDGCYLKILLLLYKLFWEQNSRDWREAKSDFMKRKQLQTWFSQGGHADFSI